MIAERNMFLSSFYIIMLLNYLIKIWTCAKNILHLKKHRFILFKQSSNNVSKIDKNYEKVFLFRLKKIKNILVIKKNKIKVELLLNNRNLKTKYNSNKIKLIYNKYFEFILSIFKYTEFVKKII